MRSSRIGLMVGFVLLFAPLSLLARAPGPDLEHFLDEADEAGLPTLVFRQGLRSVRSVSFRAQNGGAVALYYVNLNKLVFDSSLLEGGRLKSLERLSTVHVGVIYHELWHAYLNNIARVEHGPTWSKFSQDWPIYSRHPRRVWEEIQDEGYGLAIQGMLSGYLDLLRGYARADEEGKEGFRKSAALKKIWESVPLQPYSGYYSGWTGLVQSGVNLPQTHKDFILSRLFENKIERSFEKAFGSAELPQKETKSCPVL